MKINVDASIGQLQCCLAAREATADHSDRFSCR
jgi:hypothetical protein